MRFLSPPSFFPSLVTEGTYTGSSRAVSFTDMLGSYHRWLTKTSINYSAEDSRDLPPPSSPLRLDSSNVKPAAGSRSARRWLQPRTHSLAPCRLHTEVLVLGPQHTLPPPRLLWPLSNSWPEPSLVTVAIMV